MDIDDQSCLRQLSPQALALTGQLGRAVRLGNRRVNLAAALAFYGAIGRGLIFPPRGQLRGIDAFMTQQRADLTRLGTPIRGGDDATLFARRGLPAAGDGNHFGIGRRRAGRRALARRGTCFPTVSATAVLEPGACPRT